jgi:hypothetical protein
MTEYEPKVCDGYCPLDDHEDVAMAGLNAEQRKSLLQRRNNCLGAIGVIESRAECGAFATETSQIPTQRLAEGISPEVAQLIRDGKYSAAELLQESEIL